MTETTEITTTAATFDLRSAEAGIEKLCRAVAPDLEGDNLRIVFASEHDVDAPFVFGMASQAMHAAFFGGAGKAFFLNDAKIIAAYDGNAEMSLRHMRAIALHELAHLLTLNACDPVADDERDMARDDLVAAANGAIGIGSATKAGWKDFAKQHLKHNPRFIRCLTHLGYRSRPANISAKEMYGRIITTWMKPGDAVAALLEECRQRREESLRDILATSPPREFQRVEDEYFETMGDVQTLLARATDSSDEQGEQE